MQKVKLVMFENRVTAKTTQYGIGRDSEAQINAALEELPSKGHKIIEVIHTEFSALIRYRDAEVYDKKVLEALNSYTGEN